MMSRVEGQDQDQDKDRRMVDQQDGETSQLIKSNPTGTLYIHIGTIC